MTFSRLKRSVRAALQPAAAPTAAAVNSMLQLELSREFARLQAELRQTMPENPAGFGFKVYSQADEDGILERMCVRLGIDRGVFAEIGCGDGRENNTHYLLLKGWRGAWIDGDAENIAAIRAALPPNLHLRLREAFVTRENVADVLRSALDALGEPDLLSVDVDGNDLPIARAAIGAFRPKVIVAEYNAKFPYPMAIAVSYDPRRRWKGDDYHGASLAAWIDGLAPEYGLVCCNLAGTNAFFVSSDLLPHFASYPAERLYQPARFHLTALQSGHISTLSFLADELRVKGNRSRTGSTV